jgi:hypothetical protein
LGGWGDLGEIDTYGTGVVEGGDGYFVALVDGAVGLDVEEGVGVVESDAGSGEGFEGVGVEEGYFKRIVGGEGGVAGDEVVIGDGELEGFCSGGDDEGLGEF